MRVRLRDRVRRGPPIDRLRYVLRGSGRATVCAVAGGSRFLRRVPNPLAVSLPSGIGARHAGGRMLSAGSHDSGVFQRGIDLLNVAGAARIVGISVAGYIVGQPLLESAAVSDALRGSKQPCAIVWWGCSHTAPW